jgi:hypothetical protein
MATSRVSRAKRSRKSKVSNFKACWSSTQTTAARRNDRINLQHEDAESFLCVLRASAVNNSPANPPLAEPPGFVYNSGLPTWDAALKNSGFRLVKKVSDARRAKNFERLTLRV